MLNNKSNNKSSVQVWVSSPHEKTWLNRQSDLHFKSDSTKSDYAITIDEKITYQTIDGFGASLTDSSCWLLTNHLTEGKRNEVLNNVFGIDGIHITALRQTIGACDFNLETWTYDDTENNVDDHDLKEFSLRREDAYIRPILDQAMGISPGRMKLFASPWTPPTWMKTVKEYYGSAGGTLRPDCYEAYANYFIEYLKQYREKGTPIYAITVQNEPLFAAPWPGMVMTPEEQTNFINVLGPKLQENEIPTKVIAYDHNFDNIEYPQTVIAGAGQYVAGSAFHYYSPLNHDALQTVHDRYPEKDIWFTEGGSGTWIAGGSEIGMFQHLIMHTIRFSRNWTKSYITWNVALNHKGGPILTGPKSPNRGLVTINDEMMDNVTYNVEYYALGHSSKFVDPNAYRIDSNTFQDSIESVAYKNPDGSKVVVLLNRMAKANTVEIECDGQFFTYTVPADGAVTFKW